MTENCFILSLVNIKKTCSNRQGIISYNLATCKPFFFISKIERYNVQVTIHVASRSKKKKSLIFKNYRSIEWSQKKWAFFPRKEYCQVLSYFKLKFLGIQGVISVTKDFCVYPSKRLINKLARNTLRWYFRLNRKMNIHVIQ